MTLSSAEKFYLANGVIQLLPEYDINGRYQEATTDQINQSIKDYSPGGTQYVKDPNWATNYLKDLQANIQRVTTSGSQYAIDPKTGALTTKTALAEQQAQQQAIASGTVQNIGTTTAPLTAPTGSPAATLPLGGTTPAGTPGLPTQVPTYQETVNQPPPPALQQGTTGSPTAPEGMKNVGTDTAPLWVPIGSAAELQIQGVPIQQQLQTPSVQQQIAQNPSIQPVVPTPTQPVSTPTPVQTTTPITLQPGMTVPEGSPAAKLLEGISSDSQTPQPTNQNLGSTTGTQTAYPTVALQPGMTGMEVKKLQDYLVSIGLMTPEQVATGPGIYGPQTTAAVLELQKRLGIDYSSGPGYFGPKTLAALQASSGQFSGGTTPSGTTPAGTPITTGGTTAPVDQINSQITDLKAQQEALEKYGLEDTSQITKDAYGNYIPSQGGQEDGQSGTTDGTTTPPPQGPTDFADVYRKNLEDQGTSNIKAQFDKVVKEYGDLQNELNDKIAEINDNPWLTEGIRVRQIERMKEKYEGKLSILTNQQKIYESLYKEGIAEAKFLTTGAVDQQESLMQLAQDRLEAENQMLRDYQNGLYKNIKEVNGGLFDLESGQWIVQPKPSGVTDDYNKLLSPTEAQTLGVPYGTTKGQASSLGITPERGVTDYQSTQTFLNISNKYQADSIVKQAINGKTAVSLADQIIANPSKATNQLMSLYLLVKNLDPTSAVREGELALAQQTQSYLQKFMTALTRISEGQILSPETAKELALATKQLAQAWSTTADQRTQQYLSQAQTAGVGDQFNSYLGGFGSDFGSGAGVNITPRTPTGEIDWEKL